MYRNEYVFQKGKTRLSHKKDETTPSAATGRDPEMVTLRQTETNAT